MYIFTDARSHIKISVTQSVANLDIVAVMMKALR